MHVDTTSAFNINYRITLRASYYIDSFIKYVAVNHMNEHSCQSRACVQSVHHQNAHMISDGHSRIDHVPVKVKTSLHQAFLQVVDVMNHCFMHALLYNTQI